LEDTASKERTTCSIDRDRAAGGLLAHAERFMYLEHMVATGEPTKHTCTTDATVLRLSGQQRYCAKPAHGH
jgi:hypothetical protein